MEHTPSSSSKERVNLSTLQPPPTAPSILSGDSSANVSTMNAAPGPGLAVQRSTWLPILKSSNQLVLYNPNSHALTVTSHSPPSGPAFHPTQPWMRHIAYGSLPDPHDRDDTMGLESTNEGGGELAPVPLRAALAPRTSLHGAHGGMAPGEIRTCPWCSRPLASSVRQTNMQGIAHRVPNYFKLLEQTNYEREPSEDLSPHSPISPNTMHSIEGHVPSEASFRSEGALHSETLGDSSAATYCIKETDKRAENSLSGSSKRAAEDSKRSAETSFRRKLADDSMPGTPQRRFGDGAMAQGYFAAFFKEERRLGMGANGSVYLCQHVIDGNYLGHFAVKKIAVGHSHSYLLKILREVRLLETLRHPNIISYHHSWLETTRFSSFGPAVPTLHVLMEWADSGSLEDLIEARQGKPHHHQVDPGARGAGEHSDDEGSNRKSARIRAFKARKRQTEENRAPITPHGLMSRGNGLGTRSRSVGASPGVMLLSAEEIKSYLSDIVSGLAFLHDRSILHLDLKLGNVLLTKDDERIIPRAMLSDFGTSRDALQTPRVRSGNTGTVEYSAPEALARDASGSLLQVDSKSDMWSLGMILYKLIFFRLPYPEIDPTDVDGIEREVLRYGGFKATVDTIDSCRRRGLPRGTLMLLEGLLRVDPMQRPTSERVLAALKEETLELQPHTRHPRKGEVKALSIIRKRASSTSVSGEHTNSTEKVVSRRSSDPQSTAPLPKSRTRSTSPLFNRTSPSQTGISEPPLLLPAPMQTLSRGRWRTLRTCLLLLKILSLMNVCHPAYPTLLVQAFAMSLAVYDIWQEGLDGTPDLRISVALTMAHASILAAIRWRRDALCAI